jgi:hypothetical protein
LENAVFKLIGDLPPDVLAIEAAGKITHEDYHNTLIPRAEAMMASGPIKLLWVIGTEFTGFDLEALWDDGKFGLKHWHDFSRIAVVVDQPWLRTAVSIFAPFFRCEVRLFRLSELGTAKDWIAGGKRTAV